MHKCRSCTQFYLDLPHHVVGICPGLPQDASLETQHLKEIWHIAWATKLTCAHYRSIYRRKPPGTCCRIRFAWKTKKQTSKPNPRTNKSSKPTNQPTPQPNKSLWHITGFLCPRQDRKVNMTALITSYWRLENVVLHPSNHSPPDRNNLGQKGSQEVIWSILYQSEADFKEACLMSQLGINCHKRVSHLLLGKGVVIHSFLQCSPPGCSKQCGLLWFQISSPQNILLFFFSQQNLEAQFRPAC